MVLLMQYLNVSRSFIHMMLSCLYIKFMQLLKEQMHRLQSVLKLRRMTELLLDNQLIQIL